MSARKQLWLLAGGNGAGKSTFYRLFLKDTGLPFVNADVIARTLFSDAPEAHSYAAAQIAQMQRDRLLLDGHSFCFETVFSHPSKIDFVARAKALGYEVIVVAIHLHDIGLHQARVIQRVAEGGHSVPPDKVASRIPRTLAHLQAVLPLCDEMRVLDNSSAQDPFRPLLVIKHGRVLEQADALPAWCLSLIG